MSSGLYSGVSGLALGTGLYKDTSGLWGGASGLIDGFGFGNPTLNLNFLPMSTLPSTVTFSRTTQATLVDATGRITYAPNNLLTNSESFEASAWNKSGATVTANSTAAPDETTTADALVEDATTGLHLTQQSFAFVSGVSYTVSVYVKAGIRTWVQMLLPSAAFTASQGGFFDLTGAGALGTTNGTPTARTITALANGWYRISVTATATTSASGNVAIVAASANGTTSYAGSNGSTAVLLWGAQLEAVTYQTTPGTYNSTTPKNLLGFTQEFDNAAWTKSNSFVQTNLLTWSEQFDNAFWAKTNATVTANSTAAPDGTNTADNLVEDTSTGLHRVFATPACAANTTYTFTAYVKAAGRTQVRLAETTLGGAYFDLSAGTVLSFDAGVTASIQNVGSGWYRCRVTSTTGAAQTLYVAQIQGATGGNNSYTGNGAAALSLWGAQLVQGATAGDYQPTAAAAAPVQYVAPDGTLSADKLVETATNTTHRTFGTVTTAAISYTYSVYLKAAERTWAYLRIDRNGGTNPQAWFNLSTGAVGTVQTGLTASIQSAGNGWYRCAVTIDAAAAGTANPLVGVATANAVDTYAGDGTSGIFVWGAQLSNSASLDPYVYNPAAAPTSAAYYGPRFDYDPVTLAPRGLLIEEQRTNRTLNSEDFTAATWVATVVGTSTRVNDGAPLGFTRGLITATSATGGIRQVHSGLTSGQVYALSFYIQSTATSVQIVFENGTSQFGAGHNVTINPSNGTAGVLTGFTSVSIQPFGPGYVYTLITAPAGGALAANIEWRITNSGNSIWLGRPQFEAGAFATSYIPTAASQVTRNADVASMLGANFSSWYNQSEGTLLVEGSVYSTGLSGNRKTPAVITEGNFNNVSRTGVESGTSAGGSVISGGVTQASFLVGSAVSVNTPFKMALALKTNDFAFCANGGAVSTDTSGSVVAAPIVLDLGFGPQNSSGSTNTAGDYLNGHVRSITYYPTRLTDAQLQAITA